MEKYYTQRSSYGLILTEASAVTIAGSSFPGAGNIFNEQ